MFEKVNPSHPDKIADRIAGAIVDLAYKKANAGKELCYDIHPKVACEVLIGHGKCYIINETSEHLEKKEVYDIVERITKTSFIETIYNELPQDELLAENQKELHCGDNGIFKGIRVSPEERELTRIVQAIYDKYPFDGKYIIINDEIIACQSNCAELPIKTKAFNPLGYWTGGIGVDSGATNRKLGSDMGRAVTGGGLHGKDLTKADVSVNIYLHICANKPECVVTRNYEFQASCAIGDSKVKVIAPHVGLLTINAESGYIDYKLIVDKAAEYVKSIGGFEKLAEWGLIR